MARLKWLQTYPQHQWNLSQLSDKLDWIPAIDPVLESRAHLSTIRHMALSALSRHDLSVPSRELVARRQHRLLDKYLLYPDSELVLSRRSEALVAIEVRLCANILETLREEPIFFKNSIERVDMWFNGSLQRWVCAVVFGWIAEKLFSPKSIEIRRPFGVCAASFRFYGRHCGVCMNC